MNPAHDRAAQATERIDGYEVLLRFPAPPPAFKHDDAPEECAIVRLPDTKGGVMLMARYKTGWHANCGARPAVRGLLQMLADAEARAQKLQQENETLCAALATPEVYAGVVHEQVAWEREAALARAQAAEAKLAEVRIQCECYDGAHVDTRNFIAGVLAILDREEP